MTPTDGELMLRIQRQDERAFTVLYERYKDHCYRFAWHLLQRRQDADDLFQETWLRFVKALPKAGQVQDVKAWLFTIMINIHRDVLRKTKLQHMLFIFQNTDSDRQFNSYKESATMIPVIDPHENQVEVNLGLRNALDKLSEKQRQIFILKVVDGYSHQEIATIMNVHSGTIKTSLHRAVKKLRHEMADFQYK